eukprot:148085-Rhodomonas_salina.3
MLVQLLTLTQVSLYQQPEEVYLSDSEVVIANTTPSPYEDAVVMLLQLQQIPTNDGQLSCDLNRSSWHGRPST